MEFFYMMTALLVVSLIVVLFWKLLLRGLNVMFNKQKPSQYEHGWNFADRGLLDGSQTTGSLRSFVECSRDFDTYDDFDRGIEDRLNDRELAEELAKES